MSTQHPDNANTPKFSAGPVLGGEDEVYEAYYVYSRLGCDEQMWDYEGKEVDEFVVSKLLTGYEKYFKKRILGQNVFLTLRVPNPAQERVVSKVLLEVLESIPRMFDVAKHFYEDGDHPPVFEVILPLTRSTLELNRIWHYYKEFVAGKAQRPVIAGDISVKDWIGDFAPSQINVIPLVEDRDSLLSVDSIVGDYLKGKDLEYQRVFLARSDPALTYGACAAVLLLKIALVKLDRLEKERGLPIYPIVGVGGVPFRGNFTPVNVDNCLRGYPSVQTYTMQSSFKYDHPEDVVRGAIKKVKEAKRGKPLAVPDMAGTVELIDKISGIYKSEVEQLAPLLGRITPHVPSRRRRRLHVGLFGYGRSVGGLQLPRAIAYCAAFYSLGLPPEILGLSGLSSDDLKVIRETYPDFDEDLRSALRYFDQDILRVLPGNMEATLKKTLDLLQLDWESHEEHLKLTRSIRACAQAQKPKGLSELVTKAAQVRKFLG